MSENGTGDRLKIRPEDAEEVARDIDFCFEAGDLETARLQVRRLIELLSDYPLRWEVAECGTHGRYVTHWLHKSDR